MHISSKFRGPCCLTSNLKVTELIQFTLLSTSKQYTAVALTVICMHRACQSLHSFDKLYRDIMSYPGYEKSSDFFKSLQF